MLSVLLLLLFPLIILVTVWGFLALVNYFGNSSYDASGQLIRQLDIDTVNAYFLQTLPWVVGIVGVWFAIAYFANASMVSRAVRSRPLTTGMLDRLDDDELAGVIGPELTHIRNRDTRLLITSIIFVGIISTVMSLIVRTMYHVMWTGSGRREKDKGGLSVFFIVLLVGIVCCAIAYFFTSLTRFAISRKREYMADAGGAELCGNPLALASALKKISNNPGLDHVNREDVAQLFIVHPDEMNSGLLGFMSGLFSTHPDTQKRIEILEQF